MKVSLVYYNMGLILVYLSIISVSNNIHQLRCVNAVTSLKSDRSRNTSTEIVRQVVNKPPIQVAKITIRAKTNRHITLVIALYFVHDKTNEI